MPTSLEAFRSKLLSRVMSFDSAFTRHAVTAISPYRIDRSAFQEGLISSLWQAWCSFCRSTIISSASGISDAAGNPVTSPFAGRTEMEIAYVAKTFSQGQALTAIKPLRGSYLEPTWGDLTKLNLIILGLNTSNQARLLSAFGVAATLRDLQTCRNAGAHLSSYGLGEVSAARVRYSSTKFAHPSDM